MTNWMLHLYHSMPGPIRSMIVNGRGYYLRSWRFGNDTDALVEEALGRERWSPNEWRRWQEERLAYVMHRAVTRVPYYREQWASKRRHGDHASWEYLENWPILDKEPLRANPKAFIADDCDVRHMFYDHTSGTSGIPLSIWLSKASVRRWFALIEARWRRWYGVTRNDRWAMVCGQLIVPSSRKKPPFWVWNVALKQLYMSSYHLSANLIPYYLDALSRYDVQYLWGYSSSLYALAQEAVNSNCGLKMRVSITNAEPLFDHQRDMIAKAFSCPAYQTYGMSEMVTAASECEQKQLHLWPEVGWTEVDSAAGFDANHGSGDLICTGLLNADMPLIRYRLGDRGTLADASKSCSCGRALPIMTSLEGRADDLLYTRDGRTVGRLDPVFKDTLPIRGAQIVQETLDHIRIRYVPTLDFTPDAGRSIVSRLQDRMGNVDVMLEAVQEIPRSANGKVRAVICNLSPEQKSKLNQLSRTNKIATA